MTTIELRAYVLEHRSDEEALHAYLDKLHAENPSSHVYRPEDNVSEAVAEYLKNKRTLSGDRLFAPSPHYMTYTNSPRRCTLFLKRTAKNAKNAKKRARREI
ncbi:DUF6887 family protein [Brasilonema bromeliae]|uniref:DUF6887 family protein n=1 Tax=Brasilonema bromeliae TaxID=383615 RepID=UPI003BB6E9E4